MLIPRLLRGGSLLAVMLPLGLITSQVAADQSLDQAASDLSLRLGVQQLE